MQYLWLNEEEFINKTSRKFRCMAFLDGVELKGKIIKFKYHQASNSESYICLGSVCSAYFEIDYQGDETILPGNTIRLFIDINRSNGHIPSYNGMVTFGPHSITKAEKNGNIVSILAYDDLSAISGTSDEIFVSVRHFLVNYMQNYYGIFIAGNYINDDFYKQIIDYKFNTSTKNMKDKELLAYTSQLFGANVIPHNGAYGIGEKKTTYSHRWYDEHYGAYKLTPDRIYEFKKTGDLYSVDKLECIVEKEVNGETVKEKLKAGLGTKGISFSNPFMTQDILNKIYGFMGGLVYQPCTLKILGDPRLEVGDIVTVIDKDGKEYKVPIMAMDMEYDGGITTTITAYGGSDGMSSSSGPTAQAIEKVYVKMYETDQVIADKVTAAEGEIKKLSGDILDFKEGDFETLKSDTAEFKKTTTESLKAINADVETINGKQANFEDTTTKNFSAVTARIETVSGDLAKFKTGEFETLKSDTANFKVTITETLNATNAQLGTVIGDLANFKSGEFEKLKADQADFEEATTKKLTATSAQIEKVTGDFAGFKTGEFETLKSKQANFEEATAQKFTAVTGQVDSISGQFADYKVIVNEEFTSIHSTIKILDVESQRVKELLAGNITSDNIATGAITAGSGIIANGAIGDAEISSLSANKIKSGTVDTSLVTIASKDSAITITGNQLMVNDTTNAASPINRVILGKYTNGSATTYGLLIRGKDGKTVMLDGDGVHNAGITNGAIDNNKVADDANISGNKLDINSVVRSVNGATEKIQSTVVQVGDRSLNVYLGEQTNTIANNYTALQGYANTKAEYALKDAKSYADGAINALEISAKNLARGNTGELRGYTPTTGTNSTFNYAKVYTAGLKAGDTVTVAIDVEYTNKGSASGQTHGIWFQGAAQPGDVWTTNPFTLCIGDFTSKLVGTSGTIHLVGNIVMANWYLKYEYFNFGVRSDYSNGTATYKFRNLMVVRGEKEMDWSPAPEDIQAQFDLTTTSLSAQSQKLLEQAGIINSQGQLIEGHTATIQTQSETLKSHEASIKANQDSIKLKVDTQTYTSDKTVINTSISDTLKDAKSYADTKKTEAVSAAATDAKTKADKALEDSKTFTNAELTKVNTSLSKTTADITVLQGQITSKVEQTDINKSVETVKLYVDGEVGKVIEDTTESIKAAKSEIKQTTDAITQNVSNLQTTVSTHTTQIANKAETSTVTAISNRTASLEAKLTGITGKVTDYVSTTVTDSTKDLITGLETVNSSIETINSKQAGFELTLDGFATDVSDLEKTVEKKADGSALSTLTNTVSGLSSNLDGFKTSVSSTYTTKTELSNTLGSYSTTKQMNSAIEATKNAITSSVSETYSTKAELTNATGKITALETWKQEASQKITKDGIVSTVGTYYAKDTDLTAAENRITYVETKATQTADKFNWIVKSGTSASDFTVTDRLISLATARIDLSATNLVSIISGGSAKIQAKNITLDGVVTANNNFKILADGSMEASNGKFIGEVDATKLMAKDKYSIYPANWPNAPIDIISATISLPDSGASKQLWIGLDVGNATSPLSQNGITLTKKESANSSASYDTFINGDEIYCDFDRSNLRFGTGNLYIGGITEGGVALKNKYALKAHTHNADDIIGDSALSTTSLNPVQNRVVTTALNNKIEFEPATTLQFSDSTVTVQHYNTHQVIGDRVFVEISFKTARNLTANQQIKFKNYWTPVSDYDLRFLTYDSGFQFAASVSTYSNSFYLIPMTNIGTGIWIRAQLTYRTTGTIHA